MLKLGQILGFKTTKNENILRNQSIPHSIWRKMNPLKKNFKISSTLAAVYENAPSAIEAVLYFLKNPQQVGIWHQMGKART
jgi:hypothetical protein